MSTLLATPCVQATGDWTGMRAGLGRTGSETNSFVQFDGFGRECMKN